MSFDPYKDNPLEAEAKALGINWRWSYLESLGVLPEYVLPNLHSVSDALYHLIGPDPERVRKALPLLELVERADEAGRGIEIDPPGEGYLIRLEPGEWIQGATLPEAVEKALGELGDD